MKIFYQFVLIYFILNHSLTFSQKVIKQDPLRLISPSKETKYLIERREGISWINNSTNLIDIKYSINVVEWKEIFNSISADIEVVSWKVPAELDGKSVKIRINDSQTKLTLAETEYWIDIVKKTNLSTFTKITTQEKILKILPLGNSITYDNRSNDERNIPEKYGYRLYLYNLLNNRGIKFDFIGSENSGSAFLPFGFEDNAGFPGISDGQLAYLLVTGRRLQLYHGIDEQITTGPYLNTYQPNIILLHIGTNGNDNPSNGTSSNEIEDILDSINDFEDTYSKDVHVILSRIIDRVPNQTYVNTLNNNIQSMVMDRVNNISNPSYKDKITLADMEDSAGISYSIDPFGTIGNGEDGDMSDALHPNDKGYAKMAQIWFDGIIEILPKLNAKIFLEGSFIASSNSMNFELNNLGHIPLNQPFISSPWNYSGTEQAKFIPGDVVDWVLVSLRNETSEASTIAQRAGFVRKDGTIVDLDGTSQLVFTVDEGEYYVVLEHRNHLPIMSSVKIPITP